MRARIVVGVLLLSPALTASAQLDPKKKVAEPAATVAPVPSTSKSANPGPLAEPPHDYAMTAPSLVDAQAGAAAQQLYKRLRAQYGKRIFSGQTSDKFEAFTALAGKTPIIRGWDFMYYSPGNPWNGDNGSDDGAVNAAIDWQKGGGIVTFVWHWYSPSGRRHDCKYPDNPTKETDCRDPYNTKETDFDVSKAVVPGTTEYVQVVNAIDTIAIQLKRLSDAGVPVLWRPLHEAGGAWFWWGSKGPGPCLKLYDLMYDRLTNHHQLHNLIWVWSDPHSGWYPGNGKVDIVGYDSYPGAYKYDTQKKTFDMLYKMVGGQKMVALTEAGPIPDVDAVLKEDARWSYMLTWAKNALTENTPEHVKEMYAHPAIVTFKSK